MSREVLAPPLMRMEPNRCYRVNLIHDDFSAQHGGNMGAQQGQASSTTYAEEGKIFTYKFTYGLVYFVCTYSN